MLGGLVLRGLCNRSCGLSRSETREDLGFGANLGCGSAWLQGFVSVWGSCEFRCLGLSGLELKGFRNFL